VMYDTDRLVKAIKRPKGKRGKKRIPATGLKQSASPVQAMSILSSRGKGALA